jgi:hypothetical protein
VRRLVALVPLVVLLIGVVLLGVADSTASIADTNIPESARTNRPSQRFTFLCDCYNHDYHADSNFA